jgi:hypothetical protein
MCSHSHRASLGALVLLTNKDRKHTKTFHHYLVNCAFFPMVRQPPVGQGVLILEASRSHSDTPLLAGLLWTNDQPNVQTCSWQSTTFTIDIPPRGIWTRNPSKQAAADPRLRPHGHRDWPNCTQSVNTNTPSMQNTNTLFSLKMWTSKVRYVYATCILFMVQVYW